MMVSGSRGDRPGFCVWHGKTLAQRHVAEPGPCLASRVHAIRAALTSSGGNVTIPVVPRIVGILEQHDGLRRDS